jgi:hypothetical protein
MLRPELLALAAVQNIVNITVALGIEQARALDHAIAHLQDVEGSARRLSRSDIVCRALDAFIAANVPEVPEQRVCRVRRRPYCTTRADRPGKKTA